MPSSLASIVDNLFDMDSWKRFDETSLLKKKNTNAKTVWKDFETKNLGEYHDLYTQSDTLLTADVFESFIEVSYLRTRKQELNQGLIFKKVHKVIQFNQKA